MEGNKDLLEKLEEGAYNRSQKSGEERVGGSREGTYEIMHFHSIKAQSCVPSPIIMKNEKALI